MRTYRNRHPENAESYLMAFPWPEPGEVPDIPQRYFVLTEKARSKIQRFIDNFSGEKEDPWVKDMVGLAKDVLREVQ